jgi:hypothetical protein
MSTRSQSHNCKEFRETTAKSNFHSSVRVGGSSKLQFVCFNGSFNILYNLDLVRGRELFRRNSIHALDLHLLF